MSTQEGWAWAGGLSSMEDEEGAARDPAVAALDLDNFVDKVR